VPNAIVKPLLVARGLTAALPGDAGDVRVLEALDISVDSGEVVDVVGPSGSGKTTLLRALARLLPAVSGELSLAGTAAESVSPPQWRCDVSLLPQKPSIVPGTIRENLLLPWRLKARADQQAPSDELLLGRLGHLALGDLTLDRSAARLSVGQQARVAMLRVLLTEPKVLLLDEADAALDSDSSAAVTAMTRSFAERGGAVVRVRHREDDGLAARRLRMRDGRLEEVAR
jgi:putative ABC transport system ATP-binding protein